MAMPIPRINNRKPLPNENEDMYTLTEINFKDLVHSSPDAIFVYVDEKIVFANKTGLNLFRAHSPDEVIGKEIWNFIPEQSHKSLKKAVDMIINDKKTYISTQDKIIAVDGKTIDIEISSTYFNFNGRHGIQAFMRDISKRKKAEERLRKSEKDYKQIFESTGTAIIFIEEDRTISRVNGECEKISGYRKDEVEGIKKWTEFIAPEDRKLLDNNNVLRSRNLTTPMGLEFRLVDKFGKYHNVFMTITYLPDSHRSVASIIDLTEIQKAEEILAATEQNYRLLVENTKEAIAIIQDEQVRYVNPKLCEITGYNEEQILNKKFYKLVHPDFRNVVQEEYNYRLDGNHSSTMPPVKIIDTNSKERWFQINSVLTIWGDKPAVLLFFADITGVKQAQDALMASEEKYRLLAENAKDIIIIYDQNYRMDYINMSGLETFGLSRDVIKNITVKDILYSDDASEFPAVKKSTETKSKLFKNRFEAVNYRKEPILLETLSSPIKLDNGRHGILVVARDVTERKKLEKEIILISERIRQQVSRDLHDDLNPHLIGIEALTQVLSQKLKQMDLPEYNEAEKIAALISKAITKTHRLARGLCPIDLESTGIQTPLMNLTKLLRSIYSIECQFEYDESVVIEDITLATNLYYIAQEAAFNAAKYSRGTVISIILKKAKDHLLLEIKDNGMGLSSEHIKDSTHSSGMGLKIMKYRAEIIDASFTIKPNRPSGTVITVKMPLNILKGEGRINYGGRRSNREQEI